MSTEVMPTLHERETLIKSAQPKRTGFTPRPAEKLAVKRAPRNMVNIDCNHFLRTSTEEAAHGYPPLTYRMWLEAGKHDPPFPERPDSNYNSNVWRNFRRQFGFDTNAEGRKVNEMIATMYPLNIPPPSHIGEYTYAKFLGETPLIKDGKRRTLALERIREDSATFRKLRLRSDMRNPPIDQSGKIVPPVDFKKYVQKFVPPEEEPVKPEEDPFDPSMRTDLFGVRVKAKTRPYLWKLSYKLNNPQYEQVQEEYERRQKAVRLYPPATVSYH